MLRNLEAKLGGLVEGAFGRAFKTSVQPVELAHKLAKEMEENQMVSVSRVYVPNHYRVFLSPRRPRAVLELRAGAAQGAVGLPARARPPGAARAHHPPPGRVPHRRAPRARRVRHPGAAARRAGGGATSRPSRRRRPATSGTRWSTRPTARRARSSRSPTAARRCSSARAAATCSAASASSIGRSRECDIVLSGPERVTPPRRAPPRRTRLGSVDLGSTNGMKVNGRRVQPRRAGARRPDHDRHHRPDLRARLGQWTSRSP